MTLEPGTRLGPYEILAPLGAGGMGEVFRARDTRLGRDVAIKVLPEEVAGDSRALARFALEAKAVAALSHPSILALYDVGEAAGVHYAVTELLEGESLRALVAHGALPVRRALEIACQVADALAAAHEKGIVHRDVKPENVFLTKDGRAKLLDFGLARQEAAVAASRESAVPTADVLTDHGSVVGTVAYMSPEQARGDRADFRSDQFSLGVVLYEMLTGKRPFHGDSAAETLTAIIREEPEPLESLAPSVPPPVRWIVERCLAKEPGERFDATRDLARDLATARQHLSETTSRAVAAAAVAARPRLRLAAAAAIVLLAGAGLFAAGNYIGRLRSTPKELKIQRLTFRRGTVTSARLAPDGQTAVYSASWDSRPGEIFSARLDAPESRPMGFPDAHLLAVSHSSELALALRRRPGSSFVFPLGTLALVSFGGGTPRELEENVAGADFSPDGKEIALVRGIAGGAQLEFPSGRVLHRSGGDLSFPRISRSGDRVAFLDHPIRGNDAGWVAVVDRAGKARKLSRRFEAADGLAWSPDGEEIWFAGAERGGRTELRAVTMDGRERLLFPELGAVRLQDVSKSGSVLLEHIDVRGRVFFRRDGASVETELSCLDVSEAQALSKDGRLALVIESAVPGQFLSYLRATDGAPPVKLATAAVMSFSPDDSLVVAVQHTPPAVVLYPVAGGAPRSVPVPGIDLGGAGLLADGRTVWVTGSEPSRAARTWFVERAGTKPRPVTPEGSRDNVTPDGKYLFHRSGGRAWLRPVAGGEPREVRGLADDEEIAGWGPDARHFYAYRPAGIPARVFRVDTASGGRELAREVTPADSVGASQIRVLMTPDGTACAYSFYQWLSSLHVVEGLR